MAEREITMPALSPTMEEGELLRWNVAVGDEVKEGQPLVEFETDKVDTAVESPYSGTVAALLADEGQIVAVGAPIIRIDTETEDLLGDLDLDGGSGGAEDGSGPGTDRPGAPDANLGEDARTADDPATGTQDRGIVPAPPPVRSRAKRLGIDLHDLERSGKRGQVTNADIDRWLEAQGIDEHAPTQEQTAPPQRPAAPASAPTPAPAGHAAPQASTAERPRSSENPAERATASRADRRARVRRATARAMDVAAGIPQYTLHRRVELARAAEQKAGRSWTTEIVRATAKALRAHPALNATWDAEAQQAEPLDEIRIGLAVDTPQGLLVVGISEPDRLSPAQADHAVRDAAQRAIDDRLDARDTAGITFTVSNLGGLGIDWFRAVVMPPQAGILSVGRITDIPMVVNGRVKARLGTELGLTVDHRVADGADGARFLATLADILED